MSFVDRVTECSRKNNSLLCVGLDTDVSKLPHHLQGTDDGVFQFNKAIVDATHDLVLSYKPQLAFYSGQGTEAQLIETIEYIQKNYPYVPVILDAKHGDIGNTAELYAYEAFKHFGVDAVTVNPYLGGDSLTPFLKYSDRGVIVLCKTSNPGSGDFQDLFVEGQPLFLYVAKKAVAEWNGNNNVMLVVGATFPEQVAAVRKVVGPMWFLVPGVGAQGGDVRRTVQNGMNAAKEGLIINSSRGIIYASSGVDFAEAARREAKSLRDAINAARE